MMFSAGSAIIVFWSSLPAMIFLRFCQISLMFLVPLLRYETPTKNVQTENQSKNRFGLSPEQKNRCQPELFILWPPRPSTPRGRFRGV